MLNSVGAAVVEARPQRRYTNGASGNGHHPNKGFAPVFTPARVSEADEPTSPKKAQPKSIKQILSPVQSTLNLVEEQMRAVDSTLFQPLATSFTDLIGSGGKRLRPALSLMAGEFSHKYAGRLPESPYHNNVILLAAAIETLHTSTLVHDDVIDGALIRRGAPTLNAKWAMGTTILAGNFMFGHAAQFLARTNNMRALNIFSNTLRVIVDGELRQLFARNDYTQDKDNYYHRIYAKTASLFCAATECAGVLTELPEPQVQQLRDYGYNFGMAFQIIDDILDFTGNETTLGKPAGSDLRQGTLTLPFFYFLQSHASPDALVDRLQRGMRLGYKGDVEGWNKIVEQTVGELCASNAVTAARQEAVEFLQKAYDNMRCFPDNVYRQSLMDLCDVVAERTY
ncbi:MAG: polyprenyl synthetase family protein [Chloroflexota bacterium]